VYIAGNMRNAAFISILFVLLGFMPLYAQQSEYYEVPLKYVSFSLLNDDRCPIQLADKRVVASKIGSLDFLYTMSNAGHASVKSFEIQKFSVFENPSYTASPHGKADDETAFPPYETIFSANHEDLKAAELSKQQVAEFRLDESRKRLWVVLVTKVELWDGTKYDATSKYEKIKEFIETVNQEENARWDRELPPTPFQNKFDRFIAFLSSPTLNEGISLRPPQPPQAKGR